MRKRYKSRVLLEGEHLEGIPMQSLPLQRALDEYSRKPLARSEWLRVVEVPYSYQQPLEVA